MRGERKYQEVERHLERSGVHTELSQPLRSVRNFFQKEGTKNLKVPSSFTRRMMKLPCNEILGDTLRLCCPSSGRWLLRFKLVKLNKNIKLSCQCSPVSRAPQSPVAGGCHRGQCGCRTFMNSSVEEGEMAESGLSPFGRGRIQTESMFSKK